MHYPSAVSSGRVSGSLMLRIYRSILGFDYSWTIPVFAYDNSRAHAIAANVAHTLETYRRVVPLIGADGKPVVNFSSGL